MSAKEMQRWIMEKTEEHFQEAMVENKNSFRAVDPDGDGEKAYRRSHPLIIQSTLSVFKFCQACVDLK